MADVTTDERIRDYGRLVETQRRLHRLFGRSMHDHGGISMVWYEALLRLARSPEGYLSINELGSAMDLTSGGATRLVDRLVEAGRNDLLVVRQHCSDRNLTQVKRMPRFLEGEPHHSLLRPDSRSPRSFSRILDSTNLRKGRATPLTR